MFSSFYRNNCPIFVKNNLNNLNNLNSPEFRNYITESTAQYIEKKVEFYKNNPYSKINNNVNTIIKNTNNSNNSNNNEILANNRSLAFPIFLSMYGFLYYFYNRKH
jgi:hypothetical protein